ncbi:MAG TPA: DNA-3-methyladenine glycosylase 2 family protein [Rhizobiales bacterium]|nr:DNA-3-methyladenine glycosylase 2 family protein [Hyphomicrobiales bacterium]
MRRIRTADDIEEGLEALVCADPRLRSVRAFAGEVPLRLSPPGFASLVAIVVGQQVSRASADAIYGRLAQLADPLAPQALLDGGEALYRAAGLSRPKMRTLDALSHAVVEGRLDIDALASVDAAEAMAGLLAIPGIGPWTAECYLLFAAGHPDVFPARDVALQSAVAHGLGLDGRPGEKALAALAESWSPWRGVASRLFWAYYARMKGKEAVPLS